MWNEVRASYSENGIGGNARPHPGPTAIELRRNGFFPILIVILLLISKNLSRARLRLGLRLRACQCGPAAGLNSMAVPSEGERVSKELVRGSPDDFWITQERSFTGSHRDSRIS